MTTDMGRDMAGDMARGLGTVCWGVGCSPDNSLSSLFFGFSLFVESPFVGATNLSPDHSLSCLFSN
jgi:hypothetical protein